MAGGQEMCKSCSLRKCVRMCNTQSIEQCKAIDYNNGDKKCYRYTVYTARKRSCGKVMFSQVSVCSQVVV